MEGREEAEGEGEHITENEGLFPHVTVCHIIGVYLCACAYVQ